MTKMTYVQALNAVLEIEAIPEDVRERLTELRDAQIKKAQNKSSKPTAKQLENAGNYDIIVSWLDAHPGWHTCNDVQKGIEEFNDLAPQRVSGLLTQLVKNNRIQRTKIKAKHYYGTCELESSDSDPVEE